MPVYEYKALDGRGKGVSGIVDADSLVSARQKLRADGLFPTNLKTGGVPAKNEKRSFRLSFARVRPAEIGVMTRQLATLLAAGFQLVAAIEALLPTVGNMAFRKILAQVKDAILEGQPFSDALARFPRVFSTFYINLIRAGESSGTLEIVMERLADLSENRLALVQRIRSALIYPILMLLVGTGVLVLLVAFVLPNITSIFTEMNQTLPLPTRVLIGASAFFQQYWWIIFLVVVLLAFLVVTGLKSERGKKAADALLLRLPLVGSLVRYMAAARFAGTLGSLLENGVSMLVALEIVKKVIGNRTVEHMIEKAADAVEKGRNMSEVLRENNIFPHLAVQMIQVGEQSGKLETMLGKVSETFERDVESRLLGLTSLIEPVMILLLGGVIGYIVLSVCLPIFEMNQLVF